MTTHRSLAAALWLLAGAAAFAAATALMGAAPTGKVSPWALVAFFWGAAALSAAIHHLSHRLTARLALVAGAAAARLQRPQPVDAVGPDAAAEPLGKRLELLRQVEPA